MSARSLLSEVGGSQKEFPNLETAIQDEHQNQCFESFQVLSFSSASQVASGCTRALLSTHFRLGRHGRGDEFFEEV